MASKGRKGEFALSGIDTFCRFHRHVTVRPSRAIRRKKLSGRLRLPTDPRYSRGTGGILPARTVGSSTPLMASTGCQAAVRMLALESHFSPSSTCAGGKMQCSAITSECQLKPVRLNACSGEPKERCHCDPVILSPNEPFKIIELRLEHWTRVTKFSIVFACNHPLLPRHYHL